MSYTLGGDSCLIHQVDIHVLYIRWRFMSYTLGGDSSLIHQVEIHHVLYISWRFIMSYTFGGDSSYIIQQVGDLSYLIHQVGDSCLIHQLSYTLGMRFLSYTLGILYIRCLIHQVGDSSPVLCIYRWAIPLCLIHYQTCDSYQKQRIPSIFHHILCIKTSISTFNNDSQLWLIFLVIHTLLESPAIMIVHNMYNTIQSEPFILQSLSTFIQFFLFPTKHLFCSRIGSPAQIARLKS